MLINQKYFAKYSVLPSPSNYNYSDIMTYEPIAIRIWLKPLIGQYLLEELENQVKNDNLSDANATLLVTGGLWQYLCTAMCYEGLPFLWARANEVGITLGESDTYKSVTLKDLTYIQDHLRRMLEVLKEQVLQFLCEHCQSYPTFDTSACGCDCACNNNKAPIPPNPRYLIYGLPKRFTDLI